MSGISVNLSKGQSQSMRGSKSVQTALVGLGWDVNAGQSGSDLDLDVVAVGRDSSGNAVIAAYFNDLKPAPWLTHTGDNLTGQGEGDDEQIIVNLSQVPADIARIDFGVIIYEAANRGQTFAMVENAFARVENHDTGAELVRTDLTGVEFFDAVGVHIASFVRSGPMWDFVSVQEAKDEYSDVAGFVNATIA